METFSALLALCAENSQVTSEFPAQGPVTRSLDVFFDLRLNKHLSKQSWGRWFGKPSCSLWRYCNGVTCFDELFQLLTPSRCWKKCMKCKYIDIYLSRHEFSLCDAGYHNTWSVQVVWKKLAPPKVYANWFWNIKHFFRFMIMLLFHYITDNEDSVISLIIEKYYSDHFLCSWTVPHDIPSPDLEYTLTSPRTHWFPNHASEVYCGCPFRDSVFWFYPVRLNRVWSR